MQAVNSPAVPGTTLERATSRDAHGGTTRAANEKGVLRWGGLAGLLGGVIFVVSIVYQVAFVGTQTTAPGSGPVIRFPDVQTQIVVGQTLFLVATILFVPLLVALYWALRGPSLAAALFGGALSFLGVAVLAVESEPNVAMAQISAQYHAVGATAAQQAAAVQLWQATQGMFNEYDTCAYIFLSVGFIVLGLAMVDAREFGKVIGGVSAAIGIAGLFGVALFAVTSAAFALFGLLTFVLFPLLMGWRVYGLSREPKSSPSPSIAGNG